MDFSEINSVVANMQSEMERIQTEFREKMQDLFSNAVKAFFVEAPAVKAMVWTQYTPYFMDGDECIFSVNDVHFIFSDKEFNIHDWDLNAFANGDWEWNGDEEDEYDDEILVKHFYAYKREDKEFVDKYGEKIFNACVAMSGIIQSNDDIMQAVFGDHVIVAITADESITEEYEHD